MIVEYDARKYEYISSRFASPTRRRTQLTADTTEVLLVFDSIKMAAVVALNGVSLGAPVTNQFRRYTFSGTF